MSGDIVSIFLNQVLATVIRPNIDKISSIIATGEIAVALHALLPEGESMARSLGWDEKTPVFAMSKQGRSQMIASAEHNNDQATKRWLLGSRVGRIFLLSGAGFMLMNRTDKGEVVIDNDGLNMIGNQA